MLRRIRGLLAKAESTEFPDEAEALTAKAQELMTRHAVDAALLDAGPAAPGDGGGQPTGARPGPVRAREDAAPGRGRRGQRRPAGLVPVPRHRQPRRRDRRDLDAVELLFTSLLLQVAQALAARSDSSGGGSASRTFRRSFLLGYAHRIGERLRTAREPATAEAATAHGVDLLPGAAVAPGSGGGAGRRALPARADQPQPVVGRRRRLVTPAATAAERADVGQRRSSLR